jgi:hypothetical protein
MKTLKVFLLPAVGILAFVTMSHIVTSNGSPGGKSGSPGDQSKTCTDCHGGGKATDKPGWITTDIPEAGYRPGTDYSVTVRGEHATASVFGFELTAERAGNTKTGGFDKAGNNQLQLLAAGNAVTHTSSGTTPAGGAKAWTVKWKAPAAGTGDVTFYAAVNAANGNLGTSGDAIFSTKLAIAEQDLSAIVQTEHPAWVTFFPNPATDVVILATEGLESAPYTLAIYSLTGQQVISQPVELSTGTDRISLNVSKLPNGTYFAVLSSTTRIIKSKLLISR